MPEVGSRGGSARAAARRIAARAAAGALIVAVAAAVVGTGEESASGQSGPVGSEPASAVPAVLSAAQVEDLLLLCGYKVEAAFGASIFAERDWSSRRLVRVRAGTEVRGTCFPTGGGRALSCAGLAWDREWIRVQAGTAVGWSPLSCLERAFV